MPSSSERVCDITGSSYGETDEDDQEEEAYGIHGGGRIVRLGLQDSVWGEAFTTSV